MKKFFEIPFHIVILYVIYLIGSWVQETFNLFIPGSVIGLLFLFVLLSSRIIKPSWINTGTQFMLRHLTFFFIPATVGVMNYMNLFTGKGILLLLIVIVSTVIVMFTSGWISQRLVTREE